MEMRMEPELLTPGMQDTEEADLGAEESRIAGHFEKGFGTGAEQEIVEELLVLQHQWGQAVWECEDHVDVGGGEKFSSARSNPLFPSGGLTLRAIAISAAVIRNGGTIPATGALIDMTAQCGRTTPLNGQQHLDVLPTNPGAVSFDEGGSRGADEIGHLERWPAHLLLVWRLALERQGVQRTRGRMQMTFREMQVDHRLSQIVMAQQDLNRAEIGVGFKMVRGKTVPESMRMHSFLKAGPPGGLGAGMPNGFRIDRLIPAMVDLAGKEPDFGASP